MMAPTELGPTPGIASRRHARTVPRTTPASHRGPVPQDVLCRAVLALCTANERLSRRGAQGPEDGYTAADVWLLLADTEFRAQVLVEAGDRALAQWWRDRYDALPCRERQRLAEPVQALITLYIGLRWPGRVAPWA